jgi:hypothetical protein
MTLRATRSLPHPLARPASPLATAAKSQSQNRSVNWSASVLWPQASPLAYLIVVETGMPVESPPSQMARVKQD